MKEQKHLLKHSKQTQHSLKLTLLLTTIIILYSVYYLFINLFIDNKIGYEGAKAIGEALKTNTTLTEIDLWSDNNNSNSH